MNFSKALEWLKIGERVYRTGWNGRGIFIELQIPDLKSKMTEPYIFIDTTGVTNPAGVKCRVPWMASQTELLWEDWEIYK